MPHKPSLHACWECAHGAQASKSGHSRKSNQFDVAGAGPLPIRRRYCFTFQAHPIASSAPKRPHLHDEIRVLCATKLAPRPNCNSSFVPGTSAKGHYVLIPRVAASRFLGICLHCVCVRAFLVLYFRMFEAERLLLEGI